MTVSVYGIDMFDDLTDSAQARLCSRVRVRMEAADSAGGVPDKAVAVAARASYERVRPRMNFPTGFDEAPEPIRETYLDLARAALEAAAPHLMAAAWDEGWMERAEYDGASKIPHPFPNPYKDEDEL